MTQEALMSVRRPLITTAAAAALLIAPAATASAAPGSGGCKAFGQNVSYLANTMFAKGEFGENARTVATSGPRAFPNVVVHPEQDAAC
ncbi:hypothetical protein [Blastococcus brunescens]|uniref:Uncharacterized protein n=1 Tax=Blastococcus brunescens TaxID=1564165 RepID=A0ABZ1AX17_9ACTN|nr:hypothetical protein [Blastococcus sp. BMG 8361]WRL62208.1 hypothetical protein U6N30_19450 [Blastococcus sp. BMG 8361]